MKVQVHLLAVFAVSGGKEVRSRACMLDVAPGSRGVAIIIQAMRWSGWGSSPYRVTVEERPSTTQLFVESDDHPEGTITIILPDAGEFELASADLIRQDPPPQPRIHSRAALVALWIICLIGVFVVMACSFGKIITNPPKAMRIFLGVDRATNAALGGDVSESISGRANRARKAGRAWGCVMCKVLNWFDKNHCEKSAGK